MEINDNKYPYTRQFIAYIPQSYTIQRDALITVMEFVAGYISLKHSWPRITKRIDLNKVYELLEMLNIRSYWNIKLSKLSGGILQRTMLARILAVDSPIILLDEPLSNIDPDGRVEIAELLGKLSSSKLIIITSHDPLLLLDHTKKILLMGYGEYAYGDVDEIMKYDMLITFYKKSIIETKERIHIVDWH